MPPKKKSVEELDMEMLGASPSYGSETARKAAEEAERKRKEALLKKALEER